jgi:CRP/FNR family transcriptional regulator, cyclic AMP receptor protein
MDAKRLKVPPFSWLPDDVRERFAVWVGELKVDAGRHLAEQGDYAYELFAIEDGKAEVQRDGEKIAELGPGEFFGEMGVLETGHRNATVIAETPMTLLTLSHWDVKRMERQAPEVIEQLRRVIDERRASEAGS